MVQRLLRHLMETDVERFLEEGQEVMNTSKRFILRSPVPVWERQKFWRKFFMWTFAFGAVVTVLSGLLYIGS